MNGPLIHHLFRSLVIASICFVYSASESKAKPDAFIPKPTTLIYKSVKPVNNGTAPEGDYAFEVDAGTAAKSKPIKNESRIKLMEDFDATTIYYKIGNANTRMTFGAPSGNGPAATGTDGNGIIVDPVVWSNYADIINNVEIYYNNAPGTDGPNPDGSWYAGAGKEINFVDLGKFNKRYWLNDPFNGDKGSATSPLYTSAQEIGVTVTWPATVTANNPPTAKTTYAANN